MGYMFLPLQRYADFHGRSRRLEYWMFQLMIAIVGGIIGALVGVVVAMAAARHTEPSTAFLLLIGLVYLVFVLALIVPAWGVTVRRLHDQDKSGWLALLSLVPFANFVLLVFMFLPGTIGPNPYGPDPKAPVAGY